MYIVRVHTSINRYIDRVDCRVNVHCTSIKIVWHFEEFVDVTDKLGVGNKSF